MSTFSADTYRMNPAYTEVGNVEDKRDTLKVKKGNSTHGGNVKERKPIASKTKHLLI